MELRDLGWKRAHREAFSPHAEAGFVPARVAAASREQYRLLGEIGGGEVPAELAGRLRYAAASAEELPAVGDWVAAQVHPGDEGDLAIVHAVLPRTSRIVRQAAGRATEAQVVAANVDTVFVVSSLNQDFNPRRLERYLALVRDGGARPVVVLSKSDLADGGGTEAGSGSEAAPATNPATLRDAIAVAVSDGDPVPVHAVSALTGDGLDALDPYLEPGSTVALLGSSGVGKSTLVNRLLGYERQAVEAIRAGDDRGRHATTRRELIPLPGGALVIDTPGLRELALWDAAAGLADTFADVTTLAGDCRFRDCTHRGEPGCAVERAIAEGELDPGRLANYHKLAREGAYQQLRRETSPAYAEKQRWKSVMQQLRLETGKARSPGRDGRK